MKKLEPPHVVSTQGLLFFFSLSSRQYIPSKIVIKYGERSGLLHLFAMGQAGATFFVPAGACCDFITHTRGLGIYFAHTL